MLGFEYVEKQSTLFGRLIKSVLLRQISNRSVNLFLRTNDIITEQPLVEGVHEPAVISLLKHLCKEGASDFLIDVGANIGLTSFFAPNISMKSTRMK